MSGARRDDRQTIFFWFVFSFAHDTLAPISKTTKNKAWSQRQYGCLICLLFRRGLEVTSKSLVHAAKTLLIFNHKMSTHLFKRGTASSSPSWIALARQYLYPLSPPISSHKKKKPASRDSPWLEFLFLFLWPISEECCQGNVMMTPSDSSLNHSLSAHQANVLNVNAKLKPRQHNWP